VKEGTPAHSYANEKLKKSRIVMHRGTEACVRAVISGAADAFVYDQLTVRDHQKKHPEKTRAILKPLTSEPYAFAVRKGDDHFVKRVNAFLERMRATDELEEILARHGALVRVAKD